MEIEVTNEGHTILNLLQNYLLERDDVIAASYIEPHPLEKKMILNLKTKLGTTEKEAILSTIDDLVKKISFIKNEFEKL
jgi:DNA-directed RNA polymerase subunit L